MPHLRIAAAVFFLAALTGCGRDAAPAAPTGAGSQASPAASTAAPAPPLDPPAPMSDTSAAAAEDATQVRSEAAIDTAIDRTLGDHAQYRTVFRQLQQAVAGNDRAAVAALIDYPFTARIDGKAVTLRDRDAFVREYERILTPAIAAAITSQRYAELMVSQRGVMFGSGQAWLNGICRDNACARAEVRVVAIQPAPES